ncbi:Pol poly, partial [Paramuricea clavata]
SLSCIREKPLRHDLKSVSIFKRLKNMFEAMNITKDSQQKAMLLHYVGEETCDILETLNVPEPTEGSDVFKICVKALAEYFEPQKCIDHHVYVFRQQTPKSVGNDNSEEYTFTTGAQVNQLSKPIFEVQIGNTPIRIMADSGATVNILSEQDFNCLVPKSQISETKTKVYPYMSEKPLNLYGKFEAKISSKLGSSEETFYVAKGSSNSILNWSTSQKLNIIKAVSVINQPDPSLPLNAPKFIRDFPNLTSGMAEIFQKKVSDAVRGIPCVKNISDDIYIGGIDNDDHDRQKGIPVGLGAVLTQENPSTKEVTLLHYASCPRTPTQARYPQIDREALSIFWAIKRFHLFVYGTDFKVITDHMPLVTLFNNPSSKPSARIERWLLDLQQYRFT